MLTEISRFKKMLIIILTSIVSVGSACGFYIVSFISDYQHIELSSKDEDLGISSTTEEEQDTDITNIALFGVDSRSEDIEGNSDSIMIISVDKLHSKIKVISIMRDSLVSVPGYGNRKITEAYGLGGAELAVRTLNENFGLNIREYATVNFAGMAEIIDAVGGVVVDITKKEMENANGSISEQAFYAEVEPNFITEPGEQLLDGMQAVAYARIRFVDNPNGSFGDFGRTDRQRYIMEQLFNKALNMDILQYPAFAKALMPYMKTSLSIGEVLDLANIMSDEVEFVQTRVPLLEYTIDSGYNYNGTSTVYYNLEYASKLLRAFIYDDISPEDFINENVPVWFGIDGSGSYSDDAVSQVQDSSSGSSSKSSRNKKSSGGLSGTSSYNYDETTSSEASQDTGGNSSSANPPANSSANTQSAESSVESVTE